MMINFCSFEKERLKLVEKALSWFNESDTKVVKFVVGRDTLKIPRSIKIFCQFLSDLLGSLPVTNDDPIIFIPDCSSTSFKHLVDLLTTGYSEACNDMKSVVEVAKVLKIDIDNLVADKHHAEDDLEDGEIVDSDDSISQEPDAKMAETYSSLKVAAFSKSFISVPNLMTENNVEGSTISNKSCSTIGNRNKELPAIGTNNKLFSTNGNSNMELLVIRNNNKLFPAVGKSNKFSSAIGTNAKLLSTVGKSNMELPTIGNNDKLIPTISNENWSSISSIDKGLSIISNNNKLVSTICNIDEKSPQIDKYEKDSSFQCQVCDRTFSTRSGLRSHMRTTKKHTTVTNNPTQFIPNPTLKPVKVKRVGKPIISIQARHEEKCNKVMFKCNICECLNFERQCDLNNHKEAIHNWCSSCFSSFKSKGTLKNHRQRCRLALYNLMLSTQK